MDLSALTAPPPPAQAALSGTVEAVVATTPADPSEGVYVLVGAGQQRLGPCRWMGPMAPQRGAACVVTAAGNGHFLLLWYESEATINTVAAATTLTLPLGEMVTVTGNTGITGITVSYVGRRVTLMFTGAPTVTDGSNLKLAGNFVATADDTLSLICDGTNWIETGRSVN